MAGPSMPKAVKKKSGSKFSKRCLSVDPSRALGGRHHASRPRGVLLLTGVAVRADVGCIACHSMAPNLEGSAVSGHPSLECSACHASSGVTGMMVDGARAMSWVSSSQVSPVAYDDSPCIGCHTNVLEETIEARGIRVRHSDFSEMPCTRCHAGTGHALEDRFYRVAEMDDCMQCQRSSVTTSTPARPATSLTRTQSVAKATPPGV